MFLLRRIIDIVMESLARAGSSLGRLGMDSEERDAECVPVFARSEQCHSSERPLPRLRAIRSPQRDYEHAVLARPRLEYETGAVVAFSNPQLNGCGSGMSGPSRRMFCCAERRSESGFLETRFDEEFEILGKQTRVRNGLLDEGRPVLRERVSSVSESFLGQIDRSSDMHSVLSSSSDDGDLTMSTPNEEEERDLKDDGDLSASLKPVISRDESDTISKAKISDNEKSDLNNFSTGNTSMKKPPHLDDIKRISAILETARQKYNQSNQQDTPSVSEDDTNYEQISQILPLIERAVELLCIYL